MGIIAEVLDSRDILRNLLLRGLRSSYKGSALGFMWSLLNPLVTMAIFTVVFSVVLQVQLPPNAQGVRNFPAFLLVGLLPWNQISLSMSAGATSLVANGNLIRKVYFFRAALPASVVLANAVNFLVGLGLLLVVLLAVGVDFWGSIWLLPVPLAALLLLSLGLALLTSVANLYYRDTQYLVGLFTMAWFYATPIIYPLSFKEVGTRRRRRTFDEFWALRDVSFAVAPGETVGLIGPNGSGKSTLLKCLARILRPDEGRIRIQGRLSALLEVGAGFHPELTGRENVFLNGAILGLGQAEIRNRFDEIVEFAGLERFIDTPVKSYSSGMYVRLGFAIAVNVHPDVLLVDEVLAVGDEQFQRKCLARFEEMRRTGRTVVLVTHALDTVRELCDRAVFLREGGVADVGPATSVVDTYLRDVGDTSKREAGLSLAGHRYGTREVELTRVELCGADGRPGSPILAGGPMTVRMHWRGNTPGVGPLFPIHILAQDSGG